MTVPRLLKLDPKKSYFLFGPRGTGKTTYLKKNFPNSLYLNLLEKSLYFDLLKNPDRLTNIITKSTDHVIIDEVQRVPDLLDVVHLLMEERKIKFILTGSSARKLKKTNTNLLAGRALNAKMFPLTSQELSSVFSFEQAIKYGCLPTLYDTNKNINAQEYLDAYVDTYLREEIQAEGMTKNLVGFLKFLEVASFSQGELVNYSEIAREAEISRKVVENYFEILVDLLIGYFLPVFTKRAKRKLISHEKFYFFDVGVYQYLRPKGILDRTENIVGAAVESFACQELRAYNNYLNLGFELYFWRSVNGEEVDFILYGEKSLIAIEVKASNKIDKREFKGLLEFKKDYPDAKLFYLYCGTRIEEYDAIKVYPITAFMQEIKTHLLG